MEKKEARQIVQQAVHGLSAAERAAKSLAIGDRLLAQAVETSGRIDLVVRKVDDVLEQVRSGKGTLGGLIYAEDGKKIADEIARVSRDFELRTLAIGERVRGRAAA